MSSYSDRKAVLHLFNKGKKYYQIKGKTDISIEAIKDILEGSIGKIFIHALDVVELKEFSYLEESFITFFGELYEKIPPSQSVYRNFCNFFPLCLYIFFKLEGINITSSDLSYLSPKKEIHTGLRAIFQFYPEYFKRDRRQLTLIKISRIIDKFGLDKSFDKVSTRLLDLLWGKMENANESTIAASICLLTKIREG